MRGYWLPILFVLLTVTGCGVVPKQVEAFQREVKPVPVMADSARTTQKQAADYVARKAEETKVAAIGTGAAPEVVVPATESAVVASALSASLGPPESPWRAEAEALRILLQKQEASFNTKLEAYRQYVQKDVGKNIEGTGWFQISYFSYLGLILAFFVLLWVALRVYGLINPIVGVGTSVVGRASSAVLNKGFGQIFKGGQKFQEWVGDNQDWPQNVRDEVLDMFRSAQKEAQDNDVKEIIARFRASSK